MNERTPQAPILIAGAGPTGLVLALWLAKQGIRARIIDKAAEPGTASRALAVQARTLELYRQLDLAEAVVAAAHKVKAVNLWVKGAPKTRLPFNSIGEGMTPYPFLEIYPQDEHERLLIERLKAFGIEVERPVELTGFTDHGDRVSARLKGPQGEETWQGDFIAGCDGARSVVREILGLGFPGGTYRQIFYVADVEARGRPINGDLNIALDVADFLAIFPLDDNRRARLIGTLREGRSTSAGDLTFADVADRAIKHLGVEVEKVNWFSTYHVHHRVTDHFRKGRAFVLGDAAHIHSPAGGQGMNTGIGDAINLAWKLSAVLTGRAPQSLLESYEAERIGFARRLVATTDRAFSVATAEGSFADFLRIHIAPRVLAAMVAAPLARQFMFRTISQITLEYRGSPLSAGKAGEVQGGDRLPWAPDTERDNFAPLTSADWQVHVYGMARAELTAWCANHSLPLHVFPWTKRCAEAGLARDALYLVRPDTYVALADPAGDPATVERYFADRQINWRAA